MVRSLRRRVMLGLSVVALATALTAPAFAQQAASGDRDTVVVTGSRIRVDPLDQIAPITTVGEEEIDKTGLTSTADILQRLPIASGGLNQRNNNSGNFGNPVAARLMLVRCQNRFISTFSNYLQNAFVIGGDGKIKALFRKVKPDEHLQQVMELI